MFEKFKNIHVPVLQSFAFSIQRPKGEKSDANPLIK